MDLGNGYFLADRHFTPQHIPGLPTLLNNAYEYNELREVIKFLAIMALRAKENDPPFRWGALYLGQASRYPPSSILTALMEFYDSSIAHFEGAVRTILSDEVSGMIPAQYNNTAFIELKVWLIESACITDPQNILVERLAEFRVPQPTPTYFPVEVRRPGCLFPQMVGAFLQLSHEANQGGETVAEDDLVHVLREFMRVGMNCGELWRKHGPQEWDFVHDGMPQLSLSAQAEGLTQVRRAWDAMITNPFSEAPLHTREILADISIIDIALLFLVHTQEVFDAMPYPEMMRMDRMTQHFVMIIQHDAEGLNYELFYSLRQTRLDNPFLGQYLSAPGSPLSDLDVNRQPVGESFQTHGLPYPDELVPLDETELPATHQSDPMTLVQFQDWLDRFMEDGNRPGEAYESDEEELSGSSSPENQELRQFYNTELTLADPPNLVAVGPRHDPRSFGQPVALSELQSDGICFVCTCEVLTDEDKDIIRLPCGHLVHVNELDELVNAAYWMQDTVGCGLCRREICETRPVEAAEDASGVSDDDGEAW